MSKNITDIANWKDDYPFLNNVWDIYNEHDNTVEQVTKNNTIYSLCHTILTTLREDKSKYNNFCTKLIRNLGHFSEDLIHLIRSPDRCDILHNWIYNSKKKQNIPDTIINKCFEDYIKISSLKGNNYSCSYDIYNSLYKDPMNITLLNIFESNMETIRNTLNDETGENNVPCRKFVCKSVKIYNDMHDKYCENAVDGYKKHTVTCSKLKLFYSTYKFYFLKNIDKKDQIPSLDDDPKTYLIKCKKYEEEQALHPIAIGQNPSASLITLTEDNNPHRHVSAASSQAKNRHAVAPIFPHEGENEGGLMSPTLSTALGTVAGTSSILALLYKFTPGRKWLRSGIGGSGRKIHTNLYGDVPNELLFDGMEHNDYNSYSIGYEAM